jgi:hypothetical protein
LKPDERHQHAGTGRSVSWSAAGAPAGAEGVPLSSAPRV